MTRALRAPAFVAVAIVFVAGAVFALLAPSVPLKIVSLVTAVAVLITWNCVARGWGWWP